MNILFQILLILVICIILVAFIYITNINKIKGGDEKAQKIKENEVKSNKINQNSFPHWKAMIHDIHFNSLGLWNDAINI